MHLGVALEWTSEPISEPDVIVTGEGGAPGY